MRKRQLRQQPTPSQPNQEPLPNAVISSAADGVGLIRMRRSKSVWLILFALLTYSSYAIYRYQYENLPAPLSADQAGKRGFSEIEAMKHVKALTQLGPHPVGSDSLDRALQLIPKVVHYENWMVIDGEHIELAVFHGFSPQ